jgi:arylsulfatase A-like enzyme
MFGKWHLGYSPPLWPTQQGFDEFIGLGSGDGDHHTHIDRSGNEDWWRNDELRREDGYTTTLITRHSVEFISRHKSKPFFLFVSHLAIHFPWQGPKDPPHRVKGTNYDHDKWGLIPNRDNVAPHVQAMIEAVDQSVGQIVSVLEENGLAENTLLIFASDNGGYIQYADSHFKISSNGPLKGQKGGVDEGGHRVPCIVWWPGQIRGGQVIRQTTMTIDVFPTLVGLAGATSPANQQIDGVDAAPMLLRGEPLPGRMAFWRKDDERAARLGPWKLNLSNAENPTLYNLDSDIGETTNVAEHHPLLVNKLRSAWYAWERDVNSGFRREE